MRDPRAATPGSGMRGGRAPGGLDSTALSCTGRGSLAARIFFAATLLVVVVLGLTFGLTSLQAHRTADESIRHALVGRRRGVFSPRDSQGDGARPRGPVPERRG